MSIPALHTLLVIDDGRLFSDSVRYYWVDHTTEILAAHSIDEA